MASGAVRPPCRATPYCPTEFRPGSEEKQFLRGDVDGNGSIDIADALHVLGWIFLEGPEPTCLDAADTNDDGCIDLQDLAHFPVPGVCPYFEMEFCAPRPPYPFCGPDPTPDFLGCRAGCP